MVPDIDHTTGYRGSVVQTPFCLKCPLFLPCLNVDGIEVSVGASYSTGGNIGHCICYRRGCQTWPFVLKLHFTSLN